MEFEPGFLVFISTVLFGENVLDFVSLFSEQAVACFSQVLVLDLVCSGFSCFLSGNLFALWPC